MTAVAVHITVTCPACAGAGEIGTHQDYFGNWDTKTCGACRGMGEVESGHAELVRDQIANPDAYFEGP